MPSEEQLIALRKEKRERLLAAGDPYPARVARTHEAAAAVRAFEQGGEPENEIAVTVTGRVTAQRIMGKAAFLDLRDGSGRIQLHLRRDVLEEQFELISLVDLGDFVEASGTLFRTRTNEVTVAVSSWRVITKALRPMPEKFHGVTDVETRYRQRYLDLMANEPARDLARRRSEVVAEIRGFFRGRGFMEVETPILQEQAGGAAARPFKTYHNALSRDLSLRISIELHLKRLLIGGLDRVYEIGRVFRNEGIDHSHNPEFTLLESYEAYADYEDVARMVEELVTSVAQQVAGTLEIDHAGTVVNLASPWARTTYREALIEHAGFDFYDYRSVEALGQLAVDRGLEIAEGASWGTMLDVFMSAFAEPKFVQPTFLFDYPMELSPLAKRKAGEEGIVERFEVFVLGHEIANAYSELNDPVEQRERMLAQARLAAEGDDEVELADEDFLIALEHGMPPAGGLGIGIDRLVALITGAHSLREVLLFPTLRERAER